MNEIAAEYANNGFVKVAGAVEPELLQHYRERAIKKWDSMARPRVLFIEDVHSIDGFPKLQFSPKIVAAVKAIFKKPSYLNDTILMFNLFEPHATKGGWHIDAGSEMRYGYLTDSAYRFAKIGVFFQPNLREEGGGIDAIAGSQRRYSAKNALARGLHGVHNKLLEKSLEHGVISPRHLDIRAGDAVIFDSRVMHRTSTPPDEGMEAVREFTRQQDAMKAARKIVMYWNVSEHGQEEVFIYNSYRRSLNEEGNSEVKEIMFTRYLGRRFPDDYSDEYVGTCRANSIEVARVPEDVRLLMRRKYETLTGSARP